MEPIASRIRPTKLEDFVGQEHLVSPQGPLAKAIAQLHSFSFILWGPPGSGKTTLARMCASELGASFHELSVVSAGKEDVKRIIKRAGVPMDEEAKTWLAAVANGDAR